MRIDFLVNRGIFGEGIKKSVFLPFKAIQLALIPQSLHPLTEFFHIGNRNCGISFSVKNKGRRYALLKMSNGRKCFGIFGQPFVSIAAKGRFDNGIEQNKGIGLCT